MGHFDKFNGNPNELAKMCKFNNTVHSPLSFNEHGTTDW